MTNFKGNQNRERILVMSPNLKPVRITAMVMLALLFLQYELGMTTIMSDPASIPPFDFSITAFRSALDHAGIVALIHAGFGVWLVIFAIVNLVLALRTKIRSVQIVGVLSFIAVLLAAHGGWRFVLSGFQDDHASHEMATNFILSFAFFFLELYYTKPPAKTSKV